MSDQRENGDSDSSPQEGGVTEQISPGGVRAERTAIRVAPEPADEAGLSFAATPGPGDSDGGDVYPP